MHPSRVISFVFSNETAIMNLDEKGRIHVIELLDISKVFGQDLLEQMLKAEDAMIT